MEFSSKLEVKPPEILGVVELSELLELDTDGVNPLPLEVEARKVD